VHTTQRLVEAAGVLGHRARVLDPAQLQMSLVKGHARLFLNGRSSGRSDVVIPRIASSLTGYGLAIVNHFQVQGVPVLNKAQAIELSRNKMRLLQLLMAHGIGVPAAITGRGSMGLREMADMVGGFPVAIKLVGPDKFGIIICESVQSMAAAAEAVLSMGHDIIVQRYVDARKGRDIRALVLGGEVIAAVRRQPTTGKLRHSLSTGARVTRVRLTPLQRRMASESARVVGLDLAAVDMLDLKSGKTEVFEVHSSPGLKDLEQATGEDLAVPILEYAASLVSARPSRLPPPGPAARTAARQ
jgi:ribosomal protein S6--L-glutamate ligase